MTIIIYDQIEPCIKQIFTQHPMNDSYFAQFNDPKVLVDYCLKNNIEITRSQGDYEGRGIRFVLVRFPEWGRLIMPYAQLNLFWDLYYSRLTKK